ncbi:hypothetical protein EMN47_06050 [Prolixibacteraceae bacterium JC049]|nr:hypothetical protein [Prolixibacteraceae bacterium JC049]
MEQGKFRTKLNRGFKVFTLFLILMSCGDKLEPTIPYARVFLSVSLTNHNEITVPGNSLFYPLQSGGLRGLGGIILYNDFGKIRAYDAACTFEKRNSCVVIPDGAKASGITQGGTHGECTCCGSRFSFSNGYPKVDNKARLPLMEYKVSNDGTRLFIEH